MSLEAETLCPECLEWVDDADSLEAGECTWCSASLIKTNTSKSSQRKASPDLFDDIFISDDEFLMTPKPSKVKHSSKQVEKQDDNDDEFSLESILSQFKKEQKSNPKAKSKRKQVALTDSSDDEWIAPTPTPTKRKKTERGKKQKTESLYDSDQDGDSMYQPLENETHNEPAFSDDNSGSDYQRTDSEDESWLENLRETKRKAIGQEREKPRRTISLSKSKDDTALKAPSSPSSSSSTTSSPTIKPRKEPNTNRIHSFVKFNQEMRGKLAEQNKDLSPKDLSKVVSKLWNGMSKEEKAVYANKEYISKPPKPPSGNPYITYRSEQFPLVQKEFKLKGDDAMRKASSIINVRWKSLDDEAKEKYKLKAKKMREEFAQQYPEEYQAYMENMKAKIRKAKKKSAESSS